MFEQCFCAFSIAESAWWFEVGLAPPKIILIPVFGLVWVAADITSRARDPHLLPWGLGGVALLANEGNVRGVVLSVGDCEPL